MRAIDGGAVGRLVTGPLITFGSPREPLERQEDDCVEKVDFKDDDDPKFGDSGDQDVKKLRVSKP